MQCFCTLAGTESCAGCPNNPVTTVDLTTGVTVTNDVSMCEQVHEFVATPFVLPDRYLYWRGDFDADLEIQGF